MGEIIQLNQRRTESKTLTNDVIELSKKDVRKVEHIRDSIETTLEKVATLEHIPLTVAMAAGRNAGVRMIQIQGRAAAMAVR